MLRISRQHSHECEEEHVAFEDVGRAWSLVQTLTVEYRGRGFVSCGQPGNGGNPFPGLEELRHDRALERFYCIDEAVAVLGTEE